MLGRDESQLSPAQPPAALQAPLPPAAHTAYSAAGHPSDLHLAASSDGAAVDADQVAGMLNAHMAIDQINTPQARWVYMSNCDGAAAWWLCAPYPAGASNDGMHQPSSLGNTSDVHCIGRLCKTPISPRACT